VLPAKEHPVRSTVLPAFAQTPPPQAPAELFATVTFVNVAGPVEL
jgi:hypothetical protein